MCFAHCQCFDRVKSTDSIVSGSIIGGILQVGVNKFEKKIVEKKPLTKQRQEIGNSTNADHIFPLFICSS